MGGLNETIMEAVYLLSEGVGKVPPPQHVPLPLPHTSGLLAKSQLPASCERIHNRVPEHERTHRVGPCHLAANLPHLQGHLVHTIDTARQCAVRRHHGVHFAPASPVRWSLSGKPHIRQHRHKAGGVCARPSDSCTRTNYT